MKDFHLVGVTRMECGKFFFGQPLSSQRYRAGANGASNLSDSSKIEWLAAPWNPMRGGSKISPGASAGGPTI
jgi:hypothetical protein